MENKVLKFIKENNLLAKGDRIICAVSGGADSVCMLNILNELKDEFSLTLYVAHLNHKLRGDDADKDEAFVESLSKKMGLPFYSKQVDVNALAKQLKISCEEAGRTARYAFFNELKKVLAANKIATAHNTDDNIETVLMRLLRGTDLKGLSGISAHNDFDVIRPILCLKRKEIEEYLECKGLDNVTDYTNYENVYLRNKIRNKLIPNIKDEFNPNFSESFYASIENFNDANNYIEKVVENIFENIGKTEPYGISFNVCDLLSQDIYILKRLAKKTVFTLTGKSLTSSITNIICNNIREGFKTSIYENLDFYVMYNKAHFVRISKHDSYSYKISKSGIYNIPELQMVIHITEGTGDVSFSDKNTVYFDANKLRFPFTVRNRKNGDKMNLSNCGNKKIKEIFIDSKIPSFLRNNFPVFEKNEKIFWLAGVRDDADFRASLNNAGYIKISIHKEDEHEE